MIKARYLGHSCVEFDFNGTVVLVDPFITYNELAKHIDIESVRADYIFLTHGHEDHVADMAGIQQRTGATVAAIVETAAWVRNQGVESEKVIEFNLGGSIKLPFGEVKMVYALHTNSTPDGKYGGNPVGFVFQAQGKAIYFAGDTALTVEMQLLRPLEIKTAFLPIGGHYTMDVNDAVKSADLIGCEQIVGIHYNTFPPIRIDKEEAIQKFSEAGLHLHLPDIGKTFEL
ncbi:MAG TPA: metal-dependent hydrolase [Sphingobacterium sp.]|nr:metal-dependent hydrolase [Sphingobacterium sp.]